MPDQPAIFFGHQGQFRYIAAAAAELVDEVLFFTVGNLGGLKGCLNQVIYLGKFLRDFAANNHAIAP
ncbi:hypothetical protein SDC9_151507 [bioreactor metagenome]|uniref:Uncharacterized protein n=1 Tax=bioreactor metagenome TaxID=1076179 RepID=A0A645EQH4_9ZZZZ